MSDLIINTIKDNWSSIQLVGGFILYSILEYYLGKTDKVKEGSVLEFTWARIKGLFSPSRGIPNEDK